MITPQSSDRIAARVASPAQADPRAGVAKVAGKRKRRRSPGGLGRGLARILVDNGDVADERPPSGLVELVGGQSAVRLAAVETAVLDAAMRALMIAFELEALAIGLGPDPDQPESGPATRVLLPPGWSTESGPGAQLHRQLAARVGQPTGRVERGPARREVPIDGHRLWLYQTVLDGRLVVAIAIRDASLPSSAGDSLAAAAQSLAASMTDRGVDLNLRHAIHASTTISLKSEGEDVLAEVNAEWPLPPPTKANLRNRRTGVGRGTEPVQAVARAAAKACRPRCEVLFAGVAPNGAGDADVAIVLVRHHELDLRVGWAERPRGDLGAVAEAVFTAAL